MTKQQTLQTEEYKQTELGELPKSWEVVKLEQVMMPDREKIKAKDYSGKERIVAKIPFDTGQIVLREKKKTGTDLYKANKNRLLVSKINFHQGAVAITTKMTVATTHYDFYRILENSDILYLWYYFRSNTFKELFAEEIKFRGYKKEANYNFIKDFKIPLPPLPEQQRIAYVLSTIQNAQEKTDNYINALKEFKKSVMKHLFTYGAVAFDEIDKVELKETEIGKMPKSWEVVKFEDCLSDKKVKVTKLQQSQFKKIGRFPIVDQSQDLIAGYWDNKEYLFSSPLPIVIFGDHTRVFKFIDFPFVCGPDGTKILIPEISKVFPKFFYYYLKLLKIPSRGYNRHYSLLKDYLIPLPPLPEQQRIAGILSGIDEVIEKQEQKKNALKELFNSMLKDLMTAKLRVNDLEVEA